MEVIIIGGGASGMVSAIKALENNHQVTILEKNNKVLKKLLVTGNGRCNYWNTEMNLDKYYTDDFAALETILKLNKDQVLPFFRGLGIVEKNINGYYYPYSNQATSIYNALYNKVINLKGKIITDINVLDIVKKDKFLITTDKGMFKADKVILATGSKVRSDESGYVLAQKLGHSLNPLHPALVKLVGQDNFYQAWENVRCEAILSLYEDKLIKKQEYGEVQLTNYGLSGIVAFNLSSTISRGLSLGKNEFITINFVPWCKNKNELKNYLDVKSVMIPDFNLSQILEGFLNYKIINLIFKILKINKEAKWEDVKQAEVLKYLVAFPFYIKETKDFLDAQVTTGGIPLKEINPKTMESLKTKGLYLTGELLDVDGICGGYNLGFAWMSGLEAGKLK